MELAATEPQRRSHLVLAVQLSTSHLIPRQPAVPTPTVRKMGFDMVIPSADEALAVSDVHLRAMDANQLTHAQYPSPAALAFFHGWLARNTLQQARDADKGVLIARDTESGAVASFVKWLVHPEGGGEKAARDLEGWTDVCERSVLDSYGQLTEGVRKGVMGGKAYYRKFSSPRLRCTCRSLSSNMCGRPANQTTLQGYDRRGLRSPFITNMP